MADDELVCTDRFVEGVEVLHGPACSSDADCGNNAWLTCQAGMCTAADLSGCGQ